MQKKFDVKIAAGGQAGRGAGGHSRRKVKDGNADKYINLLALVNDINFLQIFLNSVFKQRYLKQLCVFITIEYIVL